MARGVPKPFAFSESGEESSVFPFKGVGGERELCGAVSLSCEVLRCRM